MLDILLVDDEPSIRLTLGDALRASGHQVTEAVDGDDALRKLSAGSFDLLISDIRLPGASGLEIFRTARERAPDMDTILITAYGDVTDAVSAMKAGARDYLTKPFDADELLIRVGHIGETRSVRRELKAAREALQARGRSETRLIGTSAVMDALGERIETIAQSDAAVLVQGESGTGKEPSRACSTRLGPRAGRPFVPVNCAAFPDTLIEAELFGHERGAFTGAVRRRDGRFKAADGGTLFLDEVAEIPLPTQAKLLRVVQEGVVEPLGTNSPVQVDVRLVCATHRDLRKRIAEGLFREDLFYRIRVLDLTVPPLRDRMSDLPLLINHFLKRKCPAGSEPPEITPRAWAALSRHDYPGNVRELEHAVEHAVVMARGGTIDLRHLPSELAGSDAEVAPATEVRGGGIRPLSEAIKEFEHTYLKRALRESGGKRKAAADLLGISRKNLWEKLRDHGISDEDLDV